MDYPSLCFGGQTAVAVVTAVGPRALRPVVSYGLPLSYNFVLSSIVKCKKVDSQGWIFVGKRSCVFERTVLVEKQKLG